MQRVWYHGTNESSAHNICEHGIDFTKSKKELDFGRGFYMTDDKNVAKKRAQTQTKKYNRIYREGCRFKQSLSYQVTTRIAPI